MERSVYSKVFKNVTRLRVWNVLIDVNNWQEWQNDIDYCKIEGDFKVGNHFFLKPKGVKPVKIFITEINEGYSFTDCTFFWGAKMYDTHTLEETSEGLRYTQTIVVKGLLSWLWTKLVAKNVAASVPKQVEALIELVRN